MDSKGGKRRGFTKAKLVMCFYRPSKASSCIQTRHKFPPPGSNTCLDFIINADHLNQCQPKQKVSFFIPDSKFEEDLYGVAADQSVDLKAETYISSVLERFKLEPSTSTSEYNKFQDVHQR